jgi:hypothetical protein
LLVFALKVLDVQRLPRAVRLHRSTSLVTRHWSE